MRGEPWVWTTKETVLTVQRRTCPFMFVNFVRDGNKVILKALPASQPVSMQSHVVTVATTWFLRFRGDGIGWIGNRETLREPNLSSDVIYRNLKLQ